MNFKLEEIGFFKYWVCAGPFEIKGQVNFIHCFLVCLFVLFLFIYFSLFFFCYLSYKSSSYHLKIFQAIIEIFLYLKNKIHRALEHLKRSRNDWLRKKAILLKILNSFPWCSMVQSAILCVKTARNLFFNSKGGPLGKHEFFLIG